MQKHIQTDRQSDRQTLRQRDFQPDRHMREKILSEKTLSEKNATRKAYKHQNHIFLLEQIACDVHKVSANHLTIEVPNLAPNFSSSYQSRHFLNQYKLLQTSKIGYFSIFNQVANVYFALSDISFQRSVIKTEGKTTSVQEIKLERITLYMIRYNNESNLKSCNWMTNLNLNPNLNLSIQSANKLNQTNISMLKWC